MEAAAKPGGGEEQHYPCDGAEPPANSAMDTSLRSQGLYRKRVAKDGSCLFRAVAEQVFHSQSQHIAIRMSCINYLRKNREKFEAFIEGPFEEYLKSLENPQEWVGQVEISALSLMYKKDFIIYQEPDSAPSHVTENGFPDKVLLCFSNGSHYDIVYPIEYTVNAALCQSILYELLYEKVFGIDVGRTLEELSSTDVTKHSSGSCEESDSEDENTKIEEATTTDMNGVKSLVKKSPKNEKPASVALSAKVLRSLNPSVYHNIEYANWQRSKRDQQKRDFSIAAGMQYSVGDKCKVRLDLNGKFYNAHIQEVQSANGPVVVFVEELGARHSVLLKNLKPLPQPSPVETWSTVSGKKMKKLTSAHGHIAQTDTDGRGSKNPSKMIKAQSARPPRLQGSREHHVSFPGLGSQQTSPEHKTLGRNPSQVARRMDRERMNDLDGISRDYFGLSPEEHKEKQTVEETCSPGELHLQDEEAFPALSNPSVSQVSTQTTGSCGQRKLLVPNDRKANHLKEEKEERRNKVGAIEEKDLHLTQISHDRKLEPEMPENREDDSDPSSSPPSGHGDSQSPSVKQNLPEFIPGVSHTPSPVFPEMHLPPAVPSVPTIVPAWPSEPPTYGPTGVPPPIPGPSVMPSSATGLDSPLVQATSSPVTGIPVPLQAVSQPPMPMSQTLNPYQDPLYPGFPLNEKGERVMTPPYSFCSTAEDLPNDKNVLRFFFNLGVKAYSCPMWAPHSYLYPLHQACLTACRMYSKVPVPVYSHHPWLQEVHLTQNGNGAVQTETHFPMQNEVTANGQSPHMETMSPSMPLFMPTAQVPENQGLVCIESENPAQALHSEYDESLGRKSVFPQPPLGQSPFLGPVPVAPIFPHLWYGYPIQGYVENSVVRPVTVPPEDTRAPEGRSPAPAAGCVELLQKAKDESGIRHLSFHVATAQAECGGLAANSTRVPKEKQTCPAALPATQAKSVLQNLSTEMEDSKRQAVLAPAVQLPNAASKSFCPKDKTDKAGATSNLTTSLRESKVQRPREESSDDECEVSDMLRSGRSKQFYNQTFGGGRRPRSEWSYPPGRAGYHYPRNEEAWKGPSTRGRGEGYRFHRGSRGRPYRNERRRANMGDGHRGQQFP
ncbi:OTU domain-containing protein 4 isoform X2 [Sphaerodactylus townsendi]|uniref:OTU domain-containing protein 4 isoform X2 n=1 Tax=Sphaerodactylus townsendi TaxID=933632 RepID=UPI002026C938|nr:OTU domain-containing protein 4 isoform X2 [Sphaerodactylus townsendi]